MHFSTLTAAINKLNAPVIKLDWNYSSLIISAVIGEYHAALATFQTNEVAKFCLSVRTDELLDKLSQVNPTQAEDMEIELRVVDRIINNASECVQVLKIKDVKLKHSVDVEASIAHAETLRVFRFEDYELQLLLNKETLVRSSDFGYKVKATKKGAIEIVTHKTTKQQTIHIPERNLNLCLDHPDWLLSVVLLDDGTARLIHKSEFTINSEMLVHVDRPTITTMQFTAKEWQQVEFAAKVAAQLKVRSPLDIYLTGIEFQAGKTLRVKAFSGTSVYSRQLDISSGVPLKFLISYQAFYRFSQLREKEDEMITLYIKDDQSFVITSESAALRGNLMDDEMYPSNWHELPISRAVPALIDRQQFLMSLTQVTEWQRWDNPNATFLRLSWKDGLLVLQGTKGTATLYPKNKGYSSDEHEVYVNATALRGIVEQMGSRFRVAFPDSEAEMLRLSDDNTEAAVGALYEPHYASFKKQQTTQPDSLVEESLSVSEGFECRAIEICPMAVEAPEVGAIDSDEDPEEAAKAKMLDFVRTYQSYGMFSPDDAPSASAVRELYRLSIPENFEQTKAKKFYNDLSDFSEYIYFITDIGQRLGNAHLTIQEMLASEELLATDIQELRTLWQISLNREYLRGYNDALQAVGHMAKERDLQGYEEIIEELQSQLPDDLPKLCDRLRVWIGRLQLSEQNLVPTMQTEFRPK
ncbi:hypothetical protein QT972_14820 [Microcoleus sp. herbarium7]|uniref:hypothetical protein n=1 Tax=Microcoleus sp. herbarium7 TaxID=3055435 RepID=UPI002FD46CE3